MNSLYGKLKGVMATSCLNLVLRRCLWYKLFSWLSIFSHEVGALSEYCEVASEAAKLASALYVWDVIRRHSKRLLEKLTLNGRGLRVRIGVMLTCGELLVSNLVHATEWFAHPVH